MMHKVAFAILGLLVPATVAQFVYTYDTDTQAPPESNLFDPSAYRFVPPSQINSGSSQSAAPEAPLPPPRAQQPSRQGGSQQRSRDRTVSYSSFPEHQQPRRSPTYVTSQPSYQQPQPSYQQPQPSYQQPQPSYQQPQPQGQYYEPPRNEQTYQPSYQPAPPLQQQAPVHTPPAYSFYNVGTNTYQGPSSSYIAPGSEPAFQSFLQSTGNSYRSPAPQTYYQPPPTQSYYQPAEPQPQAPPQPQPRPQSQPQPRPQPQPQRQSRPARPQYTHPRQAHYEPAPPTRYMYINFPHARQAHYQPADQDQTYKYQTVEDQPEDEIVYEPEPAPVTEAPKPPPRRQQPQRQKSRNQQRQQQARSQRPSPPPQRQPEPQPAPRPQPRPQSRPQSRTQQQRGDERDKPSNLAVASLPADTDNDGIPGEAGKDYPTLAKIPKTSFSCVKQPIGGYYADLETACQVVHSCQQGGIQHSFLCPNGTIFNQEQFSCQWWYRVDCASAAQFYALNDNLYKVPPKESRRTRPPQRSG